MAAADQLTEAMQRLHAAPPGEFTARRQELARELKARGEQDLARQLAAVRKPPVTAWAVNQLHRAAPAQLDALLETGSELRSVQSRVLSGDRDAATGMRALRERQRGLVHELTDRAAGELDQHGLGSGMTARRRITETLLSASAASPEVRSRLRSGTLSSDVRMQGFEGLEELEEEPEPVAEDGGGTVTSLVAAAQRRLLQAQHAAENARRNATADELRARSARERVDALQRRAEELTAAAETARREAVEAQERAADADRDAARSRENAQAAEAQAAQADAALQQLTEHARGG